MVNINIWLAPDSANLGSAQTGDGGGLTVFHAKPPGLNMGRTARALYTDRGGIETLFPARTPRRWDTW